MSLRQVRSIEWGRVVEVLEEMESAARRLETIKLLGKLLQMAPASGS